MFHYSKRAFPILLNIRPLSTDITSVPLTQALSTFKPKSPLSSLANESSVKITTLKNGLTVASQNKFGMHCTIGAMIRAGPRYESGTISGTSHFLEKLGFHSSDGFKDRDHIQSTMESCNAIFDCQISRDFIVYAMSGVNHHLKTLTHVLSETVMRPKITDEEVAMAARAIGFELVGMEMGPPVEPILNELLHSAAFHASNTLGLPRYCPKESLEKISRHEIMKFMASYYRPENTVLVGVGVDHDDFIQYVESSFLPWDTSYGREVPESERLTPDKSTPVYLGGEMSVHRDLSQYHAPMPEFAHCAIGLEGCGSRDPQFVTACLLNSLLGGGGSFSAGGPGKGMYTRLYTNVLNQYHWVNSAQAANHAYADAGVFAISGSAEPEDLHHLVRVIINELRFTAETPIGAGELQRAKNQLESMLLMNLEMNPVAFEDIARQVLASGEWKPPSYWVEKINAVTADDLHDLLARMFKSPITMVGYGRMDKWPKYQDIQQEFAAPLHSRTTTSRFPSIFKRFI
uniref:Alpha-MPP n=1 Tax=Mesocestoides corti TaxID=53468 RepID=A0A5K3FGN7_MESCO